jgi:magnesium-transporting ATPase (P-type)
LEVFPFSPRKRMSVLVRDYKHGHIILITKGADSAVFERSLPCQFGGMLSNNLNSFAKEGLRTLLYAQKIVSQKEY